MSNNDKPLKLLIFAHRAEAKSFLKNYPFKAVETGHLDLYFSKEQQTYLLLSGEGPEEALLHTAATLGLLSDKKLNLINLGIAGSLDQRTEKNKIYAVKTVYGQKNTKEMSFKSFTLSGDTDLVSSSERVVKKDQAHYLSSFAPLVDRELYGIAKAAQLFKVSLQSYKYISDEVWADEQGALCERIKEEAEVYSDALFEYYHENIKREFEDDKVCGREQSDELFDHPALHFTISLKRKLSGLLKHLEQKDLRESFNKKAFELIQVSLEEKKKGKEISQKLIQIAQEMIAPFDHQVEQSLQKIAMPFTEKGISIQFDPDREVSSFWIKTYIQHPQHLEKLKTAIEEFSFEQIENVMQGKLDV